MNQRRVRTVGRPTYGRLQPATGRRGRPAARRLNLGLIPRRLLVLGGAIILAVIGLWQFFAIKTIDVKSPARVADITVEAQKGLGASLWQQNLLTLNAAALQSSLLRADPFLKTVDVQRRWPRSLTLTVTLKQPSLGWSSGDQAYLLDHDGGVISPLPAGFTRPVVFDDSNLPVTVGQQVASSRFIAFVGGMASALSATGLTATRYEVKDTTLDLYITTNKGYQLILDTSRDPQGEVNDLRTLVGFLGKQGKSPTAYIDLRIAGKAYYK
ncbi:MAG TPA: FtsQ-type POTRA domain-containing protein [Candidatus Saccharimonadia bacterium]|nr:FtsQ-type POTRA domain-containing protein [Candidatus Saccharimonadia bacterium]